MCYIERRLLQHHRQVDRRTNSHSQIENRHTRPKPILRLSCTIHVLPQVIHLSLHPHPLTFDICIRTVATLTSLNNVPLLTSVDVVPLMKTADVVENSRRCIYSIGLKCFLSRFSLFQLVIYIYILSLAYMYITVYKKTLYKRYENIFLSF